MHVGVLTPVIGFQGGIERLSYEVARGLRARGHRVTLVPGGREGREPDEFRAAFDPSGPSARPDVVLAQKVLSPAALEPLGDVPLVLAAHDHDHTCPRSHRYLPLSHEPCHRPPGVGCVMHGCVVVRRRDQRLPLALVNPFALRDNLDRLAARASFVCCSQYLADRLHDAGVARSRLSVAHPSPVASERALVARPSAARLLLVGQLVRGKGADLAIEAVSWLPDATLTIVGDGPSRSELEAQAHRLAPGRVTFAGAVASSAVDAFYDEASVVLVPSRWPEPFGMTGIEAMRRGRPVVGADHGGIPEWLPEGVGGWRFRPGDARHLAAMTRLALDDADLGDRALAFVRERFPHDRYLDQLEATLRAACGR